MPFWYSKENAHLIANSNKVSLKRKIIRLVRSIIIGITKHITPLRIATRKVLQSRRVKRYNGIMQSFATDGKIILFSTFDGRNYSDSPKAIYEYLLTNPDFDDYTFVWAFREPDKFAYLLDNKNTFIVKVNTLDYEQTCAMAKYWLFNYRIADHIYPKDDQIYVQLWHGTPLKRLGYDIEISDNALNSKAEIREKYKTDAEKFKYILAPSDFAGEKFATAWNLEEFGKAHTLLTAGYPRNDFLINHTAQDVERIREELNLPQGKKIILYAPTWRDNQHKASVGYTYKLGVDFEKLHQQLGDEYIILFRAHYLVASQFDFAKYQGFVYNASNVSDINNLYVVSDLLITDYSSVFFDYANLNRPVIFYMYDLEDYAGEIRGFYIDLKELPGKIVQTQDSLVDEIKSTCYDTEFYEHKYQQFHQKFNPLDDGKATQRVIDAVIEKHKETVYE